LKQKEGKLCKSNENQNIFSFGAEENSSATSLVTNSDCLASQQTTQFSCQPFIPQSGKENVMNKNLNLLTLIGVFCVLVILGITLIAHNRKQDYQSQNPAQIGQTFRDIKVNRCSDKLL
jgi:hypothetical protein